MTKLRRALREKFGDGAKFAVVKNTLVKMALKDAGYDMNVDENTFLVPPRYCTSTKEIQLRQ